MAEEKEITLADIASSILEQRAAIEERFGKQVETQKQYEAAMIELKTKIEMLERMLAPNTVSVSGVNETKETFSWARAIYGVHTNNWDAVPFEKEVFAATAKAAADTGSATAGGFIIPVEYSADFIEMLEAKLVLKQAGISVMSGLTGLLEIPMQTGGATAYWVGENSDITESALTFGMKTMQPKQVAALVKSSDRMIRMTNPSIEAIIKRDISLRQALKLDLAGLRGQGTETQPRGVGQTPGINVVYASSSGGSGANISFDKLLDMEGELEDDNALFGNLGFVWNPCVRRQLMKLKVAQFTDDTAGEYIVNPMTPSKLQEWLTYPQFATTQIPKNLSQNSGTADLTEVYFGNWQELFLCMWGGVQIAQSNQTYDAFQKVQTWIRIIQDVDFFVRHAESFCIMPDVHKANV